MLLQLLFFLGTVTADMVPRIVGGSEVDIENWPFMAFIAIISSDVAATCGGSLISSQTVLTAAHCLDDMTNSKRIFDKFNFSILMGHKKFENAIMVRSVLDYETHHNYDQKDTAADIGIIFLTKPVTFSRSVKKVLLKNKLNFKKDRFIQVAGWGAWNALDDSSISPTLKALSQTLVTNRKCKHYLAQNIFHEGVFCAGEVNATEFAYSGDSGGPVVKAGSQIQIGIVFFRLEAHGITVYTSVPYYYNWIEKTQNRLFVMHCGNEKLNLLHKMAKKGAVRPFSIEDYDDI